MKYGFIGCGGAAMARVKSLAGFETFCYDVNKDTQIAFSNLTGSQECDKLEDLWDQVEIVFIGLPHKDLFSNAYAALRKGKHVLVEKPGAVRSKDLIKLKNLANKNRLVCHVGYTIGNTLWRHDDWNNFRPHMLIGKYCHGARPFYGSEWRLGPSHAGGGVGFDLLSHLIHIALLWEPFYLVSSGEKNNNYWKSYGEDFASVVLTKLEGTALLYASCSDWKNNFSLEMVGTNDKIHILDLNAKSGDISFIKYQNTGPGIKPVETLESKNLDFWGTDTKLFMKKIGYKYFEKNDLNKEIKVLQILESF